MVQVDAMVTTKPGGRRPSTGAVGEGGEARARVEGEGTRTRRGQARREARGVCANGLRAGMRGVSGHCDGCERAGGGEDT